MDGSIAVSHQPIEAVTERLNDPSVAASLVTLLDHLDLVSTLVTGLNDFFERGDTIIESLVSGVAEVREARGTNSAKFDLQGAIGHVKTAVGLLNEAMPAIRAGLPMIAKVVDSGMINDQLIEVLGIFGDSAVEGAQKAKANGTAVSGLRGTMKALKDPEVARGMGLLVEIARSLGTRVK